MTEFATRSFEHDNTTDAADAAPFDTADILAPVLPEQGIAGFVVDGADDDLNGSDVRRFDHMDRFGPDLAKRGWPILPIMPASKAPGFGPPGEYPLRDWTHYAGNEPLPNFIELWSRMGAGIGLACGGKRGGVVAVDIDTSAEHTAALRELATQMLGKSSFVRKRGERLALLYRSDAPPPSTSVAGVVDLLSTGRQIFALGWHPSGAEYEWPEIELQDSYPDDLPTIDASALDAFMRAVHDYAVANDIVTQRAPPKSGTTPRPTIARGPAQTVDATTLDAVLSVLPNDGDWNEWTTVAMAVHNSGGTFELFDTWSARSGKYDAAATAKRWATVASNRGEVRFGTLVHMLQQRGITVPPVARTADNDDAFDVDLTAYADALDDAAEAAAVEAAQNTLGLMCPDLALVIPKPSRLTLDDANRALVDVIETWFDEGVAYANRKRAYRERSSNAAKEKLTLDMTPLQQRGAVKKDVASDMALWTMEVPAPLTIASISMGLGKSTALRTQLARLLQKTNLRVHVYSLNHDLLAEAASKLHDALDGAPHLQNAVFHVISKQHEACANEERRGILKSVSGTAARTTQSVCEGGSGGTLCAFADSCKAYQIAKTQSGASGVFFLPAVFLGLDSKWGADKADLVICDDDILRAINGTVEVTCDDLSEAPSAADVPREGVYLWNERDDDQSETADWLSDLRSLRAKCRDQLNGLPRERAPWPMRPLLKRSWDRPEALTAWLGLERRLQDRLLAAIEEKASARCAGNQDMGLGGLVEEAMRSTRISKMIETAIRARRDATVNVYPLDVHAVDDKVTGKATRHVALHYVSDRLRRTKTTPVFYADGTAAPNDILAAFGERTGQTSEHRPIRYERVEAELHAGTTIVQFTNKYMSANRLLGRDGQTERQGRNSFGRQLTLLLQMQAALHGRCGAVMSKALRDALPGSVARVARLKGILQAVGLTKSTKAAHVLPLARPQDITGRLGGSHYEALTYGSQRGIDRLADRALTVIGQMQPPHSEVELQGRARSALIKGGRVAPQKDGYVIAPVAHETVDGHALGYTLAHTDPHAEAARKSICDDDVIQAVHRARPIRFGVPIAVVGTVPIGMPVHKFAHTSLIDELDPLDVICALGVLPVTPSALEKSRLSFIFGSNERLKNILDKSGLYRSSVAGLQQVLLESHENGSAVRAPIAYTRKTTLLQAIGALTAAGGAVDLFSLPRRAFFLSLVLGNWKPGQTIPAGPTWVLVDAAPPKGGRKTRKVLVNIDLFGAAMLDALEAVLRYRPASFDIITVCPIELTDAQKSELHAMASPTAPDASLIERRRNQIGLAANGELIAPPLAPPEPGLLSIVAAGETMPATAAPAIDAVLGTPVEPNDPVLIDYAALIAAFDHMVATRH